MGLAYYYKGSTMNSTNTESITAGPASRASRVEQKNERIRKKSERIAAKSKSIADRNARLYLHKTSPDAADRVDSLPSSIPCEDDEPKLCKHHKNKKSPKVKNNVSPSFGVAAILSSTAIILLVSLAVGMIFDLIPTGKKDLAYINISNNSSTHEGEYADSSTLVSAMSSVVVVSADSSAGASTGAGFLVATSQDASCDYIATNYHVVADMDNIYVRLYESGSYIVASLVGFSVEDDIAVLKIARSGLLPMTIAKYDTCRVGDAVYAIGTPEGENFSWSVTQGIISTVDRILWMYDEDGSLKKTMRVLQTDTPVNPGNSGGPLINAAGEVVGIISMKLGESEGMGFALPIDGAIEIISAIIATGSADGVQSTISNPRGLLGISCVTVAEGRWYKLFSDRIAESDAVNGTFCAKASGVYVLSTQASSAAHGKLKAGDIITEINGARIYNLNQLSNVIFDLTVGDKVTITYCRNGKYDSVTITLGAQS